MWRDLDQCTDKTLILYIYRFHIFSFLKKLVGEDKDPFFLEPAHIKNYFFNYYLSIQDMDAAHSCSLLENVRNFQLDLARLEII